MNIRADRRGRKGIGRTFVLLRRFRCREKTHFVASRFVIHVARGYSGYGLPQADLIQEGNIGLMKLSNVLTLKLVYAWFIRCALD